MKHITAIIAAFAAFLLTSCQTQNTTVMVGGSGGGSVPGFSGPGPSVGGHSTHPGSIAGRSSGGVGTTITVQHHCSRVGKTITFRGARPEATSIRCKACGMSVPCRGGVPVQQGYGRGYPGYQTGGYGPVLYPGGRYHNPDAHDAWARQQGVFGYAPQRLPHPPPGFQAYDPRRGMTWDGVSGTVQLPPSMTGR
jgi:hypothetical protein